MTLCELETAKHHAAPLECEAFGTKEEPRNVDRSNHQAKCVKSVNYTCASANQTDFIPVLSPAAHSSGRATLGICAKYVRTLTHIFVDMRIYLLFSLVI